MSSTPTQLDTPAAWKAAMRKQLAQHNVSRYAFVRLANARDLCSVHSAECLLADADKATGKRVPSLQTAIQLARLAGFDLVMVPARAPAKD
jgi:hypothetical protein